MSKPYEAMEYIEDYLYEVVYNDLDYQNAYEYFNTKRLPIVPFLCTLDG